MTRRTRRRSNPLVVFFLLILIGVGFYFNQVVIPEVPPLFLPTPTPTRDPESYITEARQFYNSGNYIQAIDAFEQASMVNPDNPRLYVELARSQIYAGDYEAALVSTSDALIKSKADPEALALRGWALYYLENYLEAEGVLEEALAASNDNNALAHAFMAQVLVAQGLFEEAAIHSRTAVEQGPNLVEVRQARGIVLMSTSNYPEAIEQFRAALAINENIPELHLLLGINLRTIGSYDQAVQEFIKANALRPEDPIPDTYIAETYAQVGQFGRAVQYAEQAVQDDPLNPVRYGNLGLMLYRNQEREKAVEMLKLAVLGGVTPDNLTIQGLELVQRGRIPEYYTILGLALSRLGRCAEALPIFQLVLASVPGDETSVYNANYGIGLCSGSIEEETTP